MSQKFDALKACVVLCAGMLLWQGCSAGGDQSLYPLDRVSAVEVADWCPVADEENVSIDSYFWVRFSGAVDVTTLNRYSVLLGSGREHIRGQVKYDPATHTVYYYPYRRLVPNGRYELFITEDVKDIYGRQVLDKFAAITFFTGDPGDVRCPADPYARVPGREYEDENEGEWETEGDGDTDGYELSEEDESDGITEDAGESESAAEDAETDGEGEVSAEESLADGDED